MKVSFIFLSTLLAISHQQHHMAREFAFPRLSPAFVQQSAYYNDDFPENRHYLDDYSVEQVDRFNNPAVIDSQIIALNKDGDENVQPRFKGYGNQLLSNPNQQNARFYFNSGVNQQAAVNAAVVNQGVVNPLLKTVTFTLTSTCTSYSVVTCVPARYVVRPVQCRRKRQIDSVEPLSDNNSQFPIVPSEIQQVEPSIHPKSWTILPRDLRQTSFDIASSKVEQSIDDPNRDLQVGNLLRKGRFYNLWQSFATGTTITTWTILPRTTTLTSIPVANPAAAGVIAQINCLPAGVSLC